MSIFQTETSNLNGGLIIPPFILTDPNLDVVLHYHLSDFLQIHQFSKGKIKLSLIKCNCCDHHERYCDIIDHLQEMNYINVISRKEMDDCSELKIKINPWYLQYIDMNPYYGDYEIDYFQFLKDEIIPELTDDNIKEKLLNSILDYSI